MRNKLRSLYYPDFFSADATLKKSILLFDEIHFMDRPSFTFEGRVGLLGAESPMRSYEQSFRDAGVPLYVHEAPGGLVAGELLARVRADISDDRFLAQFQEGLRSSPRFRELHIPPGNYGNGETDHTIYEKLSAIDLSHCPPPLEVFDDDQIPPFEYSSAQGRYKALLTDAAMCSVKMNLALIVGAREEFSPLADASPYSALLSAKYGRAVAAEEGKRQIPFTDLSLAIFDELISPEKLRSLSYGDVVRYRRESETAREAFLEHLAAIHAKAAEVPEDGDYTSPFRR